MKRLGIVVAIVSAWSLLGGAVSAQLSSNFPGVPRGSLPSGQGRFELELTWINASGEALGDTLGLGARLGVGHSWRIATDFEIGFDLTLGSVGWTRNPEAQTEPPSRTTLTSAIAYGLRFGGKWRAFSAVTPDGYGLEASLGVGFRPSLTAGLTLVNRDSTITAGAVGDEDTFIPEEVHSLTQFVAAGSYRAPSYEVDAAVLIETEGDAPARGTIVAPGDGASFRLGARYRLTDDFGLGAVLWTGGSPPFLDRRRLGVGDEDSPNVALLLSLGRIVGKWTDLTFYAPTGSLGDGVALHISAR